MTHPEIAPMAARSEVHQPPFDVFQQDAVDFVRNRPVFTIAEMHKYLSERHNLGMDQETFREYFFDELQHVISVRMAEHDPEWVSAACPDGKVYHALDMVWDNGMPAQGFALEKAVRTELLHVFAGRSHIQEDELLFYLSVVQGLANKALLVCDMLQEDEFIIKVGTTYTLPQRAYLDEDTELPIVDEPRVVHELEPAPSLDPAPPDLEPESSHEEVSSESAPETPIEPDPAHIPPKPEPEPQPSDPPLKIIIPPVVQVAQPEPPKKVAPPPPPPARRALSIAEATEEPPVVVKEKQLLRPQPNQIMPPGEPGFMFPPTEKRIDNPMSTPERSTALQVLKRLSWQVAREQGVDLEALINYVLTPGVNQVVAKNTIIRMWRRGLVWLDAKVPERPRIYLPLTEPKEERELESRRMQALQELTLPFTGNSAK